MGKEIAEARYYRKKREQQKLFDLLYVIFRSLLIIGISFIIIYPIIQKIAVAFKDKADIYNPTIYMIPVNFTWENLTMAMSILDYFPMLGKTLVFVVVTTLFTAASCALAGYGFARFNFPGNRILFGVVIITILVPTTTLMLPYYLHFKNFDFLGIIGLFNGKSGVNLINTYWPSIITSATAIGLKAGLFIYIFRQFFKGLPKEIEEAAFIDGAGGIQTFFRIMLPNAIPPMITVVLFCFVWQYNDTFYTTLFMSGMELMSLKVATLPSQADQFIPVLMGYSHSSGFKADPNHVAMVVDTGILLAILPLLALYLVVQRYFVESIERSGIVG
ncbi:MAG: carbohydrate ABC transporter permease [Candidatus Pristimantibacillus lignocellulolyticus]|uniref:Carbohydrate ABC transporter permease n=1 Tax=Candidatus Pristimantibacillus lignocellulolyticus TaxID=2994561 RepID=A0A9J6ZFK0_9BACL|nr:MAG: carbohydrate ABC transporter permease [Candidatus Pristimantibacillus lignocellulolyticus]